MAELGKPKLSKETMFQWPRNLKVNADKVTHKVQFLVDAKFGVPGAIIVTNKYHKEFYLESIAIEGLVHFDCNSWVQPDRDVQAEKRIFFSNKVQI
ncbi:PLAT/LH2 domain - like 10 [Theobroma cacao]|nr:PLAT/LH2 domain - like 10 [Theobroma cacao]